MTREEAHRIAYEDLDSMYHSTWIKVVVDDIYDDFKSRTCENCKYIIDLGIGDGLECSNGISQYQSDYYLVDKDFGCNKFERNTNETNN
jgi:hypothetical protein